MKKKKEIGIYKITNRTNGKHYIGQSTDIQRRFCEHKTKNNFPIGRAIRETGEENFTFEILELCSLEELSQKEQYYIKKFNSFNNGYNCNEGGGIFAGENNGNSILKEEDIIIIRKAYQNREKRKDVYEKFKDKISFYTFSGIWDGRHWSHIMPEVFTEESKKYYSRQASSGEKGYYACFTDEEVLALRKRYVKETAAEIYESENLKDRCTLETLAQMLWGRTYKNVPIYKKKEKRWI